MSNKKIEIKELPSDFKPKCPSCGQQLPYIGKVSKGFIEFTDIYACPLCENIIGFSKTNFF